MVMVVFEAFNLHEIPWIATPKLLDICFSGFSNRLLRLVYTLGNMERFGMGWKGHQKVIFQRAGAFSTTGREDKTSELETHIP